MTNRTSTALIPAPTQARATAGIGASAAAAAIGVSEYRRPIDAWLEATGRVKPFEGNERTQWGEALEPMIRAHYVERNHVAVHVPPASLFHAEMPFVRATPDGIVLGANDEWLYVGPQVKNVGLRQAPHWADGVTPIDYLIQGVVEMSVTNLPRIDFAVLIGGQTYIERSIERDRELEGEVLEGLAAFWKLVETDTQPAIDESRTFRNYLLAQIKRRVSVTASIEVEKYVARWREVAREMAALKAEESKLKNLVAGELATSNANKLETSLGNITVSNPRRKTRWKAAVEDMRPFVNALTTLERDLSELTYEAVNVLDRIALINRVDHMRAQLRLVLGESQANAFEDVIAAHTAIGAPSLNRPRDWTKGIGLDEDDDNHEDN